MPPRLFSRAYLVAAMIAAPAVIGAIVAIDTSRLLSPASTRASAMPTETFAEALVSRDVERAYPFIRAGYNPNEPIEFRDRDLTGDRRLLVSPLLLAVASNSDNTVRMLLGFGVRMDLPGNRYAVCLANWMGYEAIARIILDNGSPQATAECPAAKPESVPPLLGVLDQ